MTQPVTKTLSSNLKSFTSIPGPLSLPVIGSTLNYRWTLQLVTNYDQLYSPRFGARKKTHYHLALLDMFKEYGPLVRENIGGKTVGKKKNLNSLRI